MAASITPIPMPERGWQWPATSDGMAPARSLNLLDGIVTGHGCALGVDERTCPSSARAGSVPPRMTELA